MLPMPTNWQQATRQTAQRWGLDPDLFARQIGAESNFNPNARSPAGALGIAQIMPATARGWGVDPMNPQAALNAAAKAMAKYVKNYGGWRNALVAYNAGPGRVGKPLYSETRNYINKILGNRGNVTWDQQGGVGGGVQERPAFSQQQIRNLTKGYDDAIKLRQDQVKANTQRVGKFGQLSDTDKRVLAHRMNASEAMRTDMRTRAQLAQTPTGAQQEVMALRDEAESLLAESKQNVLRLQQDKTDAVAKAKQARIRTQAEGVAAMAGWNGQGNPFRFLENTFGLKRSSSDNDAPGVHTAGSFHYRPAEWGGVQGYDYGDALNDKSKLMALGEYLRRNYKHLGVNEAFYTPWGFGIDNGKLIEGYTIPNHADHVHLAIDRILGGKR